MITEWLQTLSRLITDKMWLAPVLALGAGILTSFTPCALSSVPLIIGYVGAGHSDPRRAFRLSLVFACGMAVTFTILGSLASLLGRLMQSAGSWWYLLLGLLMVLMALQIWGVYEFVPSTYLVGRSNRRGFTGAFLAGVLAGVFSSPCATPVLVALLAIVARSGNPAWGTLLLLLYSLGHSVLVLVAGTSVGFVKQVTSSGKYGTFSIVLKYAMGAVVLLIALYMFYLGF